jgi:hypothetical protein
LHEELHGRDIWRSVDADDGDFPWVECTIPQLPEGDIPGLCVGEMRALSSQDIRRPRSSWLSLADADRSDGLSVLVAVHRVRLSIVGHHQTEPLILLALLDREHLTLAGAAAGRTLPGGIAEVQRVRGDAVRSYTRGRVVSVHDRRWSRPDRHLIGHAVNILRGLPQRQKVDDVRQLHP